MVSLNSKKNHLHFIGIGGVGMSALALVLIKRGYSVSGSDKNTTETTLKLFQEGVRVFKEQSDTNIHYLCKAKKKNPIIIVSSAIPINNPELLAAQEKGLKIIHRSDVLNALVNQQPSILIAGSHGKTTTSTIVTTLLSLCKKDPTAIIGGIIPLYKSNGHSGEGKYLVAEADESDGTLVKFKGDIGLLTNIELDHTDYYKDIKILKETIKRFGENCKNLIINYDSYELKNIFNSNELTYSINSHNDVNFSAIPISMDGHGTIAKYYENGIAIDRIRIPLVGSHNLSNFIGALAICRTTGLKFEELKNVIEKIKSPSRRFELKGIWEEEKIIIDDYAHHPSEIKAAISMGNLIITSKENVFSLQAKRLIVVFQPHRYSRTKDLMEEFAISFAKADLIFILPIYSAGEKPINKVNSEALSHLIHKNYPNIPVKVCNTYENLEDDLRNLCIKNDLILFLGAGDINQISARILNKNNNLNNNQAA